MEDLYSYLIKESVNSEFKAALGIRGGYITFSNSGRRGSVKYFQIGLDNLLQTFQDILDNINIFENLYEYNETPWRDNASEYYTDEVANTMSTVQTKPMFSTLSKIIKWANEPTLDSVDPDKEMKIERQYLETTISKLSALAEEYAPRKPKKKIQLNIDIESSKYVTYLAAIKTKPFMLLAGISGTGKSRIVRKLAQATVTQNIMGKEYADMSPDKFNEERWNIHKPANFEIIQVKPNWHNSMDVVGYLSNIPERHYVFTSFVHFIIEAFKHPDVPYFLCLDEMNLAPVEEYFAEFLSAIESRSIEDGKYVTDPIIKPFREFGDIAGDMLNTLFNDGDAAKTGDIVSVGDKKEYKKADDKSNTPKAPSDAEMKIGDIKKHLFEKGLTLPANLIVIGTVNMDETTFSFSRKVLDRAMSFEMNDVHYDNFLEGTTDDELKNIVDNIGKDDLNKYLIERVVDGRNVSSVDDEDSNKVIDYLDAVNKLLDGTQFKLGYRAANEALIYLDSCKKIGCTDVNKVLDDFTLMKILSRFEGDESKLQLNDSKVDEMQYIVPLKKGISLLEALKELMTKMLGNSQSTDEKKENAEGDNTPQEVNKQNQDKFELASVKKADEMQQILERDRFVSFWN